MAAADGGGCVHTELGGLGDVDTIEVVSFDLWLTLLRSDHRFKQARARLLHDALGRPGDLERFGQVVRRMDRLADERGRIDHRDRDLGQRLTMVAEALAVPAPSAATVAELVSAQRRLVRRYPPRLIDDELRPALRELAAGRRLAVTSNTGFIPAVDMHDVLDHLDVSRAFSVTVFSDEVGAVKPSPRIFAALAEGTGTRPGAIAHIGDDPVADVEGARSAGLRAMLVGEGCSALDVIGRFG